MDKYDKASQHIKGKQRDRFSAQWKDCLLAYYHYHLYYFYYDSNNSQRLKHSDYAYLHYLHISHSHQQVYF